MINTYPIALKLITVIGCALIAGVFFAFSTFVMNALSRLPPAQGIAAMQSINIIAINPLFMTALFGTAATCLLLAVSTLAKLSQPDAVYVFIGSLLYLIGTVGVTISFNVPLNNALAIADPSSTESANLWAKYLTDWTFWNHVRTVAALIAAVLFMLAKPLY
ncbi:DUF1772 domain-containing protein [Chamaesiphon minutus]|uniref:Putative integral membrane protein n=1 Tax=Chamaesiphon minutus (strain ATCC 27169 / PCC 6605) TaxID=1173020 RepID=K9UC71_CHAP6|nr:anthrone oxygenase family protein [Chamaesiphon minutus]AFY92712.1 putative integral membrane protein [Chamaesiphon minutus PCC 6605]